MIADEQAASAASVPRIEPLTRLATGGMADIWLAREIGAAGLERFVVVKRLLPHLARDREIVDMFVSEARFVARLVHPNVVQIHELGEDDEGYFIVMEYVAGCSVRELMVAAYRAEKRLPPEVGICIIEQACRGAHAAHELTDPAGLPLGLVHRDISPHNLMIGPGGDVKLLDFGIAKATEAGGTHTGSLKGKCSYMSPEQCRAFRLDRRSDVFSLGIVLWELLVGKRLFQREAEFASMEAIVTGDYELPSAVVPTLPPELDPVIAKALATKVADRYQTADELRRALVDAAERAGMRWSRDKLDANLEDLLGHRLAQREKALRRASTADPSSLRDALIPSDSSLRPSGSGTGRSHTGRSHTGRSLTGKTGSDDVVTVVQRSSTRPGPKLPDAPADDGGHEVTLVDQSRRRSSAPPAQTLESGFAALSADKAPPQTGPERATAGNASTDTTPAELTGPPTLESPQTGTRPGVWVAVIAGVVALAVAAFFIIGGLEPESAPGPSPSASVAPLTGPPIKFAVAPTVEPEVIRKELAPFNEWLGRAVGRPVQLVIADSYKHTAELVTSGRAHLGLFPPLLYVSTHAKSPELQPLAIRLYDGSRASDGYLLVREDAPIKKAADLRKRTICLVDRTSTTGFLLPRIWMRDSDLDPDVDVKTKFSGDHLAALRDLAEGKCDAAAVYSGAYLSAQKQGIQIGQMRLLTSTGRVPQDVLMAAADLPKVDVDKLRASLVGFDPKRDVGADRVGAVMGISGFAAFEANDFAQIRKAAEKEGLIEGFPAQGTGGGAAAEGAATGATTGGAAGSGTPP